MPFYLADFGFIGLILFRIFFWLALIIKTWISFYREKWMVHSEPLIQTFLWTLWYIWKLKNGKMFSGINFSPIDTLQSASLKAEWWRHANLKEKEVENVEPSGLTTILTPLWNSKSWLCQIGASWLNHAIVSGLGWIHRDHMEVEKFWIAKLSQKVLAYMLRWKDSYGHCLIYRSYMLP